MQQSIYIFQSTLKDFLSFRRAWPWLLLMLVLVGMTIAFRSFQQDRDLAEVYGMIIRNFGFKVVALIAAIFATAVVAGEVEQRTIVYLLTRPIPRPMLLVFRWMAAWVTTSVLGTLAVVAIAAGVFQGQIFQNPIFLRDIAVVWLGAAAYSALFLFVSLVLNRAVIYCLLFAFGWESLVPTMPGEIEYASIASPMQSLTAHPMPDSGPTGMLQLSLDRIANIPDMAAFSILVGITVGAMAIGSYWFNHFEFVPREDAE
jgi:ABC-2 type transport system permease protein